MTPSQKAKELIKHFTNAQVRTKKSKEEAIASAIKHIHLLVIETLGEDLDYWEEVQEALINTN
jgi:translation elongation factor EF-1beta